MVVTTMCLLLQSKSGRNRRRRRNSSGSGRVTSEDGDSPRSPLPDVLDEINHDEHAECTCTAEEVEERQNKLSNEDVLIEEKPDEAHEIATEPGEKQIEAASEVTFTSGINDSTVTIAVPVLLLPLLSVTVRITSFSP